MASVLRDSARHPGSDSSFWKIIASYIESKERGEAPSREELLRNHPRHAAEIEAYLEGEELFDVLQEELRLPPPPRPQTVLPPGSALDDYELLEVLGTGGMGIVYRARQKSLNRFVALKMIRSGDAATPAEKDRITYEARTVADLDHPHIVPLYDFGSQGGQPYFTMKLIEGEDLAKRFSREPFEPRALASIMASVADAIRHAHERGAIHRDLKPANILLDRGGQPHVTDFGLAKIADKTMERESLTTTGNAVGTLRYMAPEQLKGSKAITTAVDIYALGVILFEGLTGRHPFLTESHLKTMRRISEAHPVRVQPSSKVPRDLLAISLKCMEREPSSRYPGAGALAEDLRAFLSGKPIRAHPGGLLVRAAKWVRRRPATAAVIAGALTGLAAFVAVILVENRRLEESYAVSRQHESEAKQKAGEAQVAARIAEAERKKLAERTEKSDRYLYSLFLGKVTDFIGTRNFGAARRWLYRYIGGDLQSRRDFVWRHWSFVTGFAKAGYQLDSEVHSIAFSTDGQFLAFGTKNGARLAVPGEPPTWLWGSPGQAIAVPPWGPLVAVSLDGDVTRWPLVFDKAKAIPGSRTKIALGRADAMTISVPADLIAAGYADGSVRFWKLSTLEPVAEKALSLDGAIGRLVFSRDGSKVAAADVNGGVCIIEPGKGRSRSPDVSYEGLKALALSSDGTMLAVGLGARGVEVLDSVTFKAVRTFSAENETTCLAFSPDGRYLAAGDASRAILVLDLRSREQVQTLLHHSGALEVLEFSPDGKVLASVDQKREWASWDFTRIEEPQAFRDPIEPGRHEAPVVAISIGNGGRRVLTGDMSYGLKSWEVAEGKGGPFVRPGMTFSMNQEGLKRGALSADGRSAALGFSDGRVEVVAIDPERGQVTQVLDSTLEGGPVRGLAFSEDGTHFAATDGSGRGRIWLRETQAVDSPWHPLRKFRQEGDRSSSPDELSFSPDLRFIAVGSDDSGNLALIDVATGQQWARLQYHSGKLLGLAFTRDSRRLISLGSGGAISWDLEAPIEKGDIRHREEWTIAFEEDDLSSMLVSQDNLLFVGTRTGKVRVLDLIYEPDRPIYVERGVLDGAPGPILTLSLSPDGRYLVGGGESPDGKGFVTIWRATPPKQQPR